MSVVGPGFTGVFFRALLCVVCLLPPTVLMGATLPGVARWVETTPQGVSWLGALCTANLAGAVFGCLFAGFYLLRIYDMSIGTFVAAAINAPCGVLAWCSPRGRVADAAAEPRSSPPKLVADPGRGRLSHHRSLGADRAWRAGGLDPPADLLLGTTVYTFSIILAVSCWGWDWQQCGIVSRAGQPRSAALGW